MKPLALTIIPLPVLIVALAYQYARQAAHTRTYSNRGDLRDALKNQTLEEINLKELKLHINAVPTPNVPGRPVDDSKKTETPSSQNLTSLGDWAGCEDPNRDHFPITLENGKLKQQCRPDTLYRWAEVKAGHAQFDDLFNHTLNDWVLAFNEEMPKKKLRRPLFAHINPIATYGYGNAQIRIKLKKDMKFVFFVLDEDDKGEPYCGKMTDEQKKVTILIKYFTRGNGLGWAGVDYILCSTGPIHSWSIGTSRAYDEMIAAQDWITKQPLPEPSSWDEEPLENKTIYAPDHNWLPYVKYRWSGSLHPDTRIDDKNWNPEHLRLNINLARQMSEQHLDKIYYAHDVAPDENAHFLSSHKTYWNSK